MWPFSKKTPIPTPPPPAVVNENFQVIQKSERLVRWKCGHDFAEKFAYSIYGETLNPREQVFKKRERCGDCMLNVLSPVVIRCGLCGHHILPGEGIALYVDTKDFVHREWITFHDKQVVGCLRWDCCPSGAYFAGHWGGDHVDLAFAGGLGAAATVMCTGQAVVVSDTNKE